MLIFANQLVQSPQSPEEVINMIYQDVQQGYISENRINSAFTRIMKLKEKLRANR